MNKNSVDYQALDYCLNKPKSYKLSEVKDKIRKVAFDVVRFQESQNIDGLWRIQSGDDGDYTVAMYDDENPFSETKISKASDWSVVTDSSYNQVSIFYKNTPVTRVALDQIGIPSQDREFVSHSLPVKLAHNINLVSNLLLELPLSERVEFLTRFPELNKKVS